MAGGGADHPILPVADGQVVCVALLAVRQELVAMEAAAGGVDGPAAMELQAMPPMAAAVQVCKAERHALSSGSDGGQVAQGGEESRRDDEL